MTPRKYTLDQARNAAKNVRSFRQLLLALGLTEYGEAYRTIQLFCIENNIDTSHFTSQGWAKNSIKPENWHSSEHYLIKGSRINSYRLKGKLLREKKFEYKCCTCLLTEWNKQPIPLELDHINGDNTDNRLENLRLLCPNCHAQTDTHAGKNKGSGGRHRIRTDT